MPADVDMENRFFIIRHAESEANVQDLIVSDPEVGRTSYGLTQHGRQQVLEVACRQLIAVVGETQSEALSNQLVVVSSDFKRGTETAEIIHQHFKAKKPLRIDERLRERNFGELNMTSSTNYQKVWSQDALDPNHTTFGCETVSSVLSRTTALIKELEEEFKNEGKVILLVSHGDTLQITMTAFVGVSPQHHRSLDHLRNCDVRELVKILKD